jgi:hypothetical protein
MMTADIFHTYSTYARGLDILLGRTTARHHCPRAATKQELPAWRGCGIHDRYDDKNFVDPWNEKRRARAGGEHDGAAAAAREVGSAVRFSKAGA